VTVARAPQWAINGGWPSPHPDEPFDIYWSRVGAPDDIINWALNGLEGAAEDCANDRMTTWLRLTRPGLFLEELDRMAFRARIPAWRIGVSQQYSGRRSCVTP
jgi:hypothetical protein